MTQSEKHLILTAYHGEVEHRKWYLTQTDYHVIKHAEGIEDEDPEIKEKRTAARDEINTYEEWIKEIEQIVPEDLDPEPREM